MNERRKPVPGQRERERESNKKKWDARKRVSFIRVFFFFPADISECVVLSPRLTTCASYQAENICVSAPNFPSFLHRG